MIKRLFSLCVLLCALTVPALGGHVKVNGAFCDGDCVGNVCAACGASCNESPEMNMAGGNIKDTSTEPPDGSLLDDALVFAFALFMVYRLKM